MKTVVLCLLAALMLASCNYQPKKIESDFKSYFDDFGVEGSMLIFDENANKYIVYNDTRCETGYLPASTFKILNSIIALETTVVRDTSQILKWNGEEYGIPAWNRDQKLKHAFHVSCVPCYQEIARNIGLERMKKYISETSYGKMDISSKNLDYFWLEGDSRITSYEQVNLLVRLKYNKLPFMERNQELVKEIMIVEENNDYTLRAKTGWATQDDVQIGWYVGYIENSKGTCYFALNIQKPEGDILFRKGRRGIAMNILENLGYID